MVAAERLLAVLAAVFFTIAGSHQFGVALPDWTRAPEYWWQTPDQAAAELYAEGRFAAAARHFRNAAWRGAACFRAADYTCAEAAFAEAGIDAASRHLNLGNVAAHLGRFEHAVAEYDAALAVAPGWTRASENRRIVLELIVERSRRSATEDSAQGGNPAREPQQPATKRKPMQRRAGGIEIERLDPDSLAERWLRQLRNDAGEFLRLRFADEAARQGKEAAEGRP